MKKLLPIFLFSLAASFLHSAEPWTRALTPWSWSFPRDHGAHPEFKTEWWYLTGNLDDEKGNPYGYELTFFRHGLQPKPTQPDSAWSIRDIYFAHLAITDVQSRRFIFSEKLSRGALGEVEISQKDMQVRIADWSLQRKSDSSFQMAASDPTAGIGLKLSATPLKPLTYQGEKGLSRKSATPGNASHYYSFTRLQTTGRDPGSGGGRVGTVTRIAHAIEHQFVARIELETKPVPTFLIFAESRGGEFVIEPRESLDWNLFATEFE